MLKRVDSVVAYLQLEIVAVVAANPVIDEYSRPSGFGGVDGGRC